jgi:hypothetical protein
MSLRVVLSRQYRRCLHMPCHPNGSCVARINTQEEAQIVPQFIKREKIKNKKI